MKLLLDTHALLWWLEDDKRLGAIARAAIEDPANTVLVSTVSLWEIVVKCRVGKLQADIGEILTALRRDAMDVLAITLPHLQTLAGLAAHHRDPFDHLLLSQAMAEGATFVSDDRRAPLYGVVVKPCAG